MNTAQDNPDPTPSDPGLSDAKAEAERRMERTLDEALGVPPNAAADEGTVRVPAPEAPDRKGDAFARFQRGVIGWFEKRRLGGARAALIGAGLAGTAGLCLAISHGGFAGLLGLIAVFFLWVAGGIPVEPSTILPRKRPFVDLLTGLSDLCLIGGIALAGAADGSVIRVLLPVCVLGLLMLLPRAGNAQRGRAGVDLWSPDERRLVLLVSALFGHTLLPLILIVGVGTTDLTARLLRTYAALQSPPNPNPLPPGLSSLYVADGRPHPGVRIAAALVVVLLLVVLGTEADWRF